MMPGQIDSGRRELPAQTVVVCILGMHRSGTSCLAGCLEEGGLEMGDVVEEAPFNVKGNRENLVIRRLNDAVLAFSEGSWDNPPANVRWNDGHRAKRDQIISGYARFLRWGFKDPRTLLTLDFWLEALPELEFVGTFRHPAAVAASLAARNGFPENQAFQLWHEYNRRLLDRYNVGRFPIVSFDLPVEAYRATVRSLISDLGLKVDPDGPYFVDSALMNHSAQQGDPIPTAVRELYLRLREVSIRGNHVKTD